VRCVRRTCSALLRLFSTELFNVHLQRTPLLQFSGECLLQVTQTELSLIDARHPHDVIANWPLCTIRQYGRPTNDNFTFVAGR